MGLFNVFNFGYNLFCPIRVSVYNVIKRPRVKVRLFNDCKLTISLPDNAVVHGDNHLHNIYAAFSCYRAFLIY